MEDIPVRIIKGPHIGKAGTLFYRVGNWTCTTIDGCREFLPIDYLSPHVDIAVGDYVSSYNPKCGQDILNKIGKVVEKINSRAFHVRFDTSLVCIYAELLIKVNGICL